MPIKPKKVPMRMCVSCREMKPKKELMRVVVPTVDGESSGEAVLDLKGKMPGRGAYLCRNSECLKKAQKSRAVERALECQVPEATWEALGNEAMKPETDQ
ncbi:MAG: YlxR family protein [Clostridia bacterium]|nr:YlxR family protein [Clostridia bacterium]